MDIIAVMEGWEGKRERDSGNRKARKVYGGFALKREGLSSKYGGCPGWLISFSVTVMGGCNSVGAH